MVGIVVVSHSDKLVEGVIHLTKMSAKEAKIVGAGGLEDKSYGTSFDIITNAINEVYSEDGVIVIVDMGSAVMTSQMAIEMLGKDKVVLADCPLVEGAVTATIMASNNMDLDTILNELKSVSSINKV